MWNMLKKLAALKMGQKVAEKALHKKRTKTRKERARKDLGSTFRLAKERLGKGKKSTSKRRSANWTGVAGGLIGGAAGLVTFYLLRSKMKGGSESDWAQSGQAPSRTHIQLSSHPAAQSRFQPPKRAYGR